MIEDIQSELDNVSNLIKDDLNDPKLAKLRPDLFRELIHTLKEKEFMSRSSVNTNRDELLSLSLKQFQ